MSGVDCLLPGSLAAVGGGVIVTRGGGVIVTRGGGVQPSRRGGVRLSLFLRFSLLGTADGFPDESSVYYNTNFTSPKCH